MAELPPIVAFVGRKNSGKTTLLVAVAAELKRRGLRVASVKHGHHSFEIDHPGRDSWRHVHEGEVEAVLLLSSGRLAMVMEVPGEEPAVEEMVARHFGGRDYDIVLVEGFKQSALPKVEIYRRGGPEPPLSVAEGASTRRFLALVTDDTSLAPGCPVIPLGRPEPDAPHVHLVADLAAGVVARSAGDG